MSFYYYNQQKNKLDIYDRATQYFWSALLQSRNITLVRVKVDSGDPEHLRNRKHVSPAMVIEYRFLLTLKLDQQFRFILFYAEIAV